MADNGDMQAHEASYNRLIGMIKWGAIATAIVAALVIWAIATAG